ncbi:MAG TPA: hypothetical protein VIA81_02010 [Acidimicrobiia bacterium]|jgi:hypothetical protein
MGGEIDLLFEIVDESADAEEMELASRSLRRELAEVDSVATEIPETASQPGAKGDVTLLGTIAVSMISAAVPAVVALVGRWAQDRGRCVVRVSRPDGTTLEIPHVLEREQIDRIVSSLIPD